MLSLISQVLYVTVIPAGLVLGSTPERVAVLAVAAVLLLRVVARRWSAAGTGTHLDHRGARDMGFDLQAVPRATR